jgi:hypothetical protein
MYPCLYYTSKYLYSDVASGRWEWWSRCLFFSHISRGSLFGHEIALYLKWDVVSLLLRQPELYVIVEVMRGSSHVTCTGISPPWQSSMLCVLIQGGGSYKPLTCWHCSPPICVHFAQRGQCCRGREAIAWSREIRKWRNHSAEWAMLWATAWLVSRRCLGAAFVA